MQRLILAGLLAVSAGLVVRGGAAQPAPVNTGVDASVRTDAGTDRAAASATCGGLTYVTIPRRGATTTVRGDTTAAWLRQTAGLPRGDPPIRARAIRGFCAPMSGQLVYRYVVGPRPATLRVSTTNRGTQRNFDTVLYVSTRCSALLTSAFCNDDDPALPGRPDRRATSLLATDVLPAGQVVFIVVGGFYPPGDNVTSVDHGRFELTIHEDSPAETNHRALACV
jgi:hypothetical protein